MVVDAAIELSHWALRALTGIVEISAFQMLSAGKTVQLVDGGKAALA